MENLEIANNLNLNTYEEVRTRVSPHQNHIQLIATNILSLVCCSRDPSSIVAFAAVPAVAAAVAAPDLGRLWPR